MISISNSYNNLQSKLDDGYKLEEVSGWLEIGRESFPANSCLFDVMECTDGFTIQFWFKTIECNAQVSCSSLCTFFLDNKFVSILN